MGFAAITTLADGFRDLPPIGQYLHLFGLSAVAVSMLLLMTPAAIHRISQRGNASHWFYKTAGRLILAGLAALAVSISTEMFVVFLKVTGAISVALLAGLGSLTLMFGTWFALPHVFRSR